MVPAAHHQRRPLPFLIWLAVVIGAAGLQRTQGHNDGDRVDPRCPSTESRRISSEAIAAFALSADASHVRTIAPPSDPRSQRTLLTLDEKCSPTLNLKLEEECFHPVASATAKCQSTELPYLAFSMADASTDGAQMGHYKLSYAAAIRRAIPELQSQHGWAAIEALRLYTPEWWAAMRDADIVIIGQLEFATVVGCFPDKRYIILMANDAATLSQSLTCSFDDERIIGLLAHTSLRPVFENNGPLVENRRHFAWLSKKQPYSLRQEKITPAIAEKVHTIIPQIFRWRYPLDCGGRRDFTLLAQGFKKPVEEWLRPFDQRPIDIAFVGVINEDQLVRDVYGVNDHRAKAMKAIEALQAKHKNLKVLKAGHRISYAKFISLLRDTKIFVSPFGLGEFSGKDYEAMIAGSLVVKPYADKIESYPNIYDKRLAINVDVEFEGLEEAVMPYLSDPALSWERARRSLETLRRHSSVEVYAQDLDTVLVKAASRVATYNRTTCHQLPPQAFDAFGERMPPASTW